MKLAAFGLIAAVLAMTGGAAYAEAVHPVCVAKHHGCARTTQISRCCCADQDASAVDSTPVLSRVEMRADMSATAALPFVLHFVTAPRLAAPVHVSPPRLCLLDLPTLFATLLI